MAKCLWWIKWMQLLTHINPYTPHVKPATCMQTCTVNVFQRTLPWMSSCARYCPKHGNGRPDLCQTSGSWMYRLTLVLWRSRLPNIIKFKFTLSPRDHCALLPTLSCLLPHIISAPDMGINRWPWSRSENHQGEDFPVSLTEDQACDLRPHHSLC